MNEASRWEQRGGLQLARVGGGRRARRLPGAQRRRVATPLDSLNLGLSVGDDPGNVLENRRRLCAALGCRRSARRARAGARHDAGVGRRGRGGPRRFDSPSVIREHDGLLTATPGLGLAISYADCVPVVIVASARTGRCSPPSTPAGAACSPASSARPRELARRGRLIGGRRRPQHRAVLLHRRRRAAAPFEARFPGSARRRDGRPLALRAARARGGRRARGSDHRRRPVHLADQRFFSHRRDHGATGRHLAIAWRQEPRALPK